MADADGAGRKKQLVVVVDSTTRDAAATTLLLQNFGYTVMTVRTAEEALELISIASPSLVITELALPAMGGLDLLARVRADERLMKIPVIIQTSRPDIAQEDRCKSSGCTLYLRKPVPSEDLYRAVQSTIEPTPRQNLRVSVYLKASVDGTGVGSDLVTVLSDKGMFVKTLNPRPIGTRHTVSFMVNRRIIKVEAVVLYVYGFDEGPGKEPGMGMRFAAIDAGDQAFIQEFIRQQVTPPIAPPRS